MTGEIVSLDAADIRTLHEDIVAESEVTAEGVRTPSAIESARAYVMTGYFGEAPSTIHEKATHLMRLLVAEHPFVDGNKRTALNSAAVLYDLNGYDFAYNDESIRTMLKSFGTDVDAVDITECVCRCRDWASAVDEGNGQNTTSASGDAGENDRGDRNRLRERARSAEGTDRRTAVRRLGTLERERNTETYERLARE